MTVGELITLLQSYPPEMRVEVLEWIGDHMEDNDEPISVGAEGDRVVIARNINGT